MAKRECAYCGTTKGLRVSGYDPFYGRPDDFVCADCFTGTDTGPCFDDLPVAADLAGEAEEALRVLAASATPAEYATAWGKVEQALNTLRLNGLFFEADAGQLQFDITAKAKQPMIRAEYNAIRVYSSEEIRAFNDKFRADSAVTDAMLTKISALHADTASLSRSVEASTRMDGGNLVDEVA